MFNLFYVMISGMYCEGNWSSDLHIFDSPSFRVRAVPAKLILRLYPFPVADPVSASEKDSDDIFKGDDQSKDVTDDEEEIERKREGTLQHWICLLIFVNCILLNLKPSLPSARIVTVSPRRELTHTNVHKSTVETECGSHLGLSGGSLA